MNKPEKMGGNVRGFGVGEERFPSAGGLTAVSHVSVMAATLEFARDCSGNGPVPSCFGVSLEGLGGREEGHGDGEKERKRAHGVGRNFWRRLGSSNE